MMTRRFEMRMSREPWRFDSIPVYLYEVQDFDGEKTISIVEPIKLRKLERGESCSASIPTETFCVKQEEAQQFMDELWRIGIRPTEGAGSAGQMAATEKHLDDMRRLVFKGKP